MRSSALLLACLLPTCAACDLLNSDPPGWRRVEDGTVPDSIAELYRLDAARLALRIEDHDDVELPGSLVDSVFDALALVHNATQFAARDDVVERHRIHTFPQPEVFELLVGVKPFKAWVGAWQAGRTLTGNGDVDALLETYDLSLATYYEWSFGHAALLRAAAPLNIAALGKRFEGIDGVTYAEPNGWGGDGNDIRARSVMGMWELEYSLGWGDCPAGCTARHYWTFMVRPDGFVLYVGGRGDPIPDLHW